ncbi:hypothetical protein HELRODRAFT_174799 [Helobdella robusta]|uniref:Uncharacterized protein n=1 Tax=Helobdella robusta TaxID=6412 RepID=T1F8H7_HELRO|nr:hypothetical protein HELRODRAFT_174799 [Helobdella robusta]ESO01252.1 hypothetical protein HELRODRAFT_174799 [Helobdella robusta]
MLGSSNNKILENPFASNTNNNNNYYNNMHHDSNELLNSDDDQACLLISEEDQNKILSPVKFIIKMKKSISLKSFRNDSSLGDSVVKFNQMSLSCNENSVDNNAIAANVDKVTLSNINYPESIYRTGMSRPLCQKTMKIAKLKNKKRKFNKFNSIANGKYAKFKSNAKKSQKNAKRFAKNAGRIAWSGIKSGFKLFWAGLQSLSSSTSSPIPLVTFDLSQNIANVIRDIGSNKRNNNNNYYYHHSNSSCKMFLLTCNDVDDDVTDSFVESNFFLMTCLVGRG